MHETRTFRGISMRLAKKYLESVGAETVGEDYAEGQGWRAELAADTVTIGRSIELTEITVTFEGDETVLEGIVEQFARKAVRAGG